MRSWHGNLSPFGSWHTSRAFSPFTELFPLSQPGVWYDPSDVANLNWRRNLLTWTEQFDNAIWTKTEATIVANVETSPDGALADRFVPSTNAASHWVNQTITAGPSGSVARVRVKLESSVDKVTLYPGSSGTFVNFDLTNQTVANEANVTSSSITSLGGGWFDLQAIWPSSFVTDRLRIYASSGASGAAPTAGNGTSGVLIARAQLELGSVATEYQRITDVNTEVIERFPTATLYQDAAGTTPVTAPAQPVGLVLDKSKGLVSTQQITNSDNEAALMGSLYIGGPVTAAQGTVARSTEQASSGTASAKYTATNSSSVPHYVNFGTIPSGVALRISGKVYLPSNAIAQIKLVDTSDGSLITPINGGVKGAWVSFSLFRPAKATAWPLAIGNNDPESALNSVFYLDDVSILEVAGNHATQSTAAARPIYGVHPFGGRRNLLTFTEQFDNAAWFKENASVSPNFATAPDGTSTAGRLLETATTAVHAASQTITVAATAHGYSIYLKKGNGATAPDWVQLAFGGVSAGYANFNLSSGTVGVTSGATASISSIGSGWFRCSIVSTPTAGTISVQIVFTNNTDSATRRPSYAGATTSDVLIWGAQLETGSTATAYQKVVSQFEVTQTGVPSLSYLFFDGVDDFLITPTITPGTDKVQVFAGVRKLSDAAAGFVAELSTNSTSTAGSFGLLAPSASLNDFQFRSGGSNSGITATATGYSSPTTRVLTGIGDISGDVATLRVNGTQVAQSTADQGTGNFLAYPLYIGRRAGTSLPFNGNLYGLIVRFGANLPTTLINQTERWVGDKTGVSVP